MPAIPASILEPLWDQFAALLPTRHPSHPLGCHRPRIPDRVIFDSWYRSSSSAALPPHRRPDLLGQHTFELGAGNPSGSPIVVTVPAGM
jgi:hypothetical protein